MLDKWRIRSGGGARGEKGARSTNRGSFQEAGGGKGAGIVRSEHACHGADMHVSKLTMQILMFRKCTKYGIFAR